MSGSGGRRGDDKPFTTTVAEAVELLTLAKSWGGCSRCITTGALTPIFRRCAESCYQRAGTDLRFESTYDRYRPTSKPGAWREKPGPGSGVLFDLAPHLIDQAFMLLGAPLAISADVRIERAGFRTDDAFDLYLYYPEAFGRCCGRP